MLRPGPKRRGICLMTDSEAKKAWYCFESFLTNFLFLFSFFSASTSIHCKPIDTACRQKSIDTTTSSKNLTRNKSINLTAIIKKCYHIGTQASISLSLKLATLQSNHHRTCSITNSKILSSKGYYKKIPTNESNTSFTRSILTEWNKHLPPPHAEHLQACKPSFWDEECGAT